MNTICFRTRDDLSTLLRHELTAHWSIDQNRLINIRYVEVYNWNLTRKIRADYRFFINDPRPENSKKIIYYRNGQIINNNTNINFTQICIRYRNS